MRTHFIAVISARSLAIKRQIQIQGHSHSPLTSFRACSSWLNSSSPGTHMLIRYGSMTPRGAHMRRLASPLRSPLLLPKVVCNLHVALPNLTQHLFCIDIIWSTSVQCADSQSRAEVKRLCECPGEWIADLVWLNLMFAAIITRRSENDNTPQPLDQWTNSPFMGQQVGNCKSFTLTHYLADLFAMHCDPRASPSWIRHCIQLASLLFQVDQPSHS